MYRELLESKRAEILELGFVIPDEVSETMAYAICRLSTMIDEYPVTLLTNYQAEITDLFIKQLIEDKRMWDDDNHSWYGIKFAIEDVITSHGFKREDIIKEGQRQHIIREARKLGMSFPKGEDIG